MKKITILLLLILSFCNIHGFAQDLDCGTELELNTQQRAKIIKTMETDFQQFKENMDLSRVAPITVPIQIHIVRQTAGTGGIAHATIQNEIDNYVNPRFAPMNVSFAEIGPVNYIDSDTYYNISSTTEGNQLSTANNTANVLNIYFVDYAQGYCGWANFTSYLPNDYIVMANGCANNTSTLVHEIGHYFDLYHTHETSFGNELVNGSNCATAGDLLCDTPADPVLSGKVTSSCNYLGTGTDSNGDTYVPDTTQIMSYAPKTCRVNFSPDAYAKMLFTINNGRSYLNYIICEPPSITCPPDVTISCDESTNPSFTGEPTFINGCGNITITFNDVITPDIGSNFNITRTWTATDENGNQAQCVQTINVVDNTPPTYNTPASFTAECSDPILNSVLVFNSGPKVRLTVDSPIGQGDYLTTRDVPSSGGASRLLTSAPITAEVQLVNDGSGSITDGCEPIVDDLTGKIALIDRGSCFFGTKAQNAYDAGAIAVIVVNRNISTGDELVSGTASSALIPLIYVSYNTGEVIKNALTQETVILSLYDNDYVVTDNCDANPALTYSVETILGDCPQEYQQTITFTYTDASGNSSFDTQTINIVDTTPPVAPAAPADVTVQCADDVPAPLDLTATDNCNGDITVSPTAVITPGGCDNQFKIVRTWTFVDACGNQSSVSQTINVDDTTPPVAPAAPADVTVQCADDVPAPLDLTATDNCNGDITVSPTAVITPGICDNQFTMVRTWTFVDTCGNQSSVSQTINVNDTTPPVLIIPKDEIAECDKVPIVGLAMATDNCDGTVDAVYLGERREDGDCINNYTLYRTWTAKDICGNTTTLTQTITVQDTTAPTVTGIINNTFDMGCNIDQSTLPDPQSHIDNGDITGKDNCEGDVTIKLDRTEYIENDCKHYVIYYYKAIDVCGNETAEADMASVVYYWQEDDIQACAPSYARFKDANIYFAEDAELNSNNPGWTNYFDTPGEYTLSLFASVTDSDTFGDKSGEVTVNYTGDTVTLEYNMYEPYVMSEAAIYIGCEKYPIDDKGDFTTDPSYYNINTGDLDHVRNYTVGPIRLSNTEAFYLITNPVTCLQKCDCSKSADEGGTYIPNNDTVFCKRGDVLSTGNGFNNAAFKAYPVPFENEVFLEYLFNYDTNVTIEVFDLKGALLNRTIDSNYSSGVKATTKLNMKGLSDEMYFVRLTTNKGSGIKKIIAQ